MSMPSSSALVAATPHSAPLWSAASIARRSAAEYPDLHGCRRLGHDNGRNAWTKHVSTRVMIVHVRMCVRSGWT